MKQKQRSKCSSTEETWLHSEKSECWAEWRERSKPRNITMKFHNTPKIKRICQKLPGKSYGSSLLFDVFIIWVLTAMRLHREAVMAQKYSLIDWPLVKLVLIQILIPYHTDICPHQSHQSLFWSISLNF